ncbi:class GN sortase [Petrachloros mirabilis]
MNPIRPTSPRLIALTACLLTVGLWQIGEGSWIYAKARFAQYLLQRAWSRTLAGETDVKPWPWADTWPVARLTVPAYGIDQIVLNGAYGRTLAFGPGYAESSAFPGSSGTTILTGHRDTHFQFLKRLRQHDEIIIETLAGKSIRYRILDSRIVDSRKASIKLDPEVDRLILVTCYPFDAIAAGGSLRYVVTAGSIEEMNYPNRRSAFDLSL